MYTLQNLDLPSITPGNNMYYNKYSLGIKYSFYRVPISL